MKLRPFELALVIVFVVLGLLSLALLATYNPPPKTPDGGAAVVGGVSIWSTMPGDGLATLLEGYAKEYPAYANVTYRFVDSEQFESELVNALADGVGPDLVLVSHEELVPLRRRIAAESYESFPLPDIRTRYIDGAELFALRDGLVARPLAVDPLVLFWNRDIFATAGHLEPPRTWETLVNNQLPDLIDRDFNRTINRAVVAMGEYGNVRNGFGVLSMLLLQGGTAGVEETDRGYVLNLDKNVTDTGRPLRAAIDFYTRFSQPANSLYSWNRSFREDRTEFVGENLALYFGYASEGPELERLNPNLNFDIAEVPQGSAATVRRTYGQFYGLALLSSTKNPTGTQVVLQQLSQPAVADAIAINSGLVPVTRSTVNRGSNDRFGRIAYQSAAISYGWLNPGKAQADRVFATITGDISENRRSLDEAIVDSLRRLQLAY